jgi:hypothetical protein
MNAMVLPKFGAPLGLRDVPGAGGGGGIHAVQMAKLCGGWVAR